MWWVYYLFIPASYEDEWEVGAYMTDSQTDTGLIFLRQRLWMSGMVGEKWRMQFVRQQVCCSAEVASKYKA